MEKKEAAAPVDQGASVAGASVAGASVTGASIAVTTSVRGEPRVATVVLPDQEAMGGKVDLKQKAIDRADLEEEEPAGKGSSAGAVDDALLPPSATSPPTTPATTPPSVRYAYVLIYARLR